MHRIGVAACFAAAFAIIVCAPGGADAAGIYEDAWAESALLLSPPRTAVRASMEVTTGGTEGSVYRLYAAFPVRAFLIAIDQPFVARTDSSDIATGLGDLRLRGRARLWDGDGRGLYLLGYLGAGTGQSRFFPYSSQTIDVNVAAGYADSLGAVTVWAIAGYTRVGNFPEDAVVRAGYANHSRLSAGASLALGSRAAVDVGALLLRYQDDGGRDLVFATGWYRWTPALAVFLDVQFETGPPDERVNERAAIGGVAVEF